MDSTPAPAPTTTSTRRLPRNLRSQQLLSVAEVLFAEKGLDGTSVEDIAQAAGVTRAVVYQHFAGKEGIFVACAVRAREEFESGLAQLIREAGAGLDLDRVVTLGGEAFFQILERNPRRWALLFSASAALSDEVSSQLGALRNGTIDRVRELAQTLFPEAECVRVEAFAFAVSGTAEQLGRFWLTRPDLDRRQIVGYFHDFLVPALRTLATGPA